MRIQKSNNPPKVKKLQAQAKKLMDSANLAERDDPFETHSPVLRNKGHLSSWSRHPFFEKFSKEQMSLPWPADINYEMFTGRDIEALFYASLGGVWVSYQRQLASTYRSLEKRHLLIRRPGVPPLLSQDGEFVIRALRTAGLLPGGKLDRLMPPAGTRRVGRTPALLMKASASIGPYPITLAHFLAMSYASPTFRGPKVLTLVKECFDLENLGLLILPLSGGRPRLTKAGKHAVASLLEMSETKSIQNTSKM